MKHFYSIPAPVKTTLCQSISYVCATATVKKSQTKSYMDAKNTKSFC